MFAATALIFLPVRCTMYEAATSLKTVLRPVPSADPKRTAKRIADLPANRIKSSDLEAWLDHLAGQKLDPQTRRHAQTGVKHGWNRGTKHPSPTPYLSPTYRPCASVEGVCGPPKALREEDPLTDAEVKTLFTAAEVDLDRFHRFGPNTAPGGQTRTLRRIK